MLTLKLRSKDNWRFMAKIEAKIERGVEAGVKDTVDAVVADIRSSWSPTAPSSWGNPPAVRSGVLDRSVKADRQGRDLLGRFASLTNSTVWFIHADTADEDPRGYNYGMALEDENYLNRPFLSTALERAGLYFTTNIKKRVK